LFDTDAFENASALSDLSVEQVIQVIDYPAFFHLTRTPLPENRSLILEYLEQAGIISYDVSNDWSISNRGALLFAVNLGEFPALARKAMRVVQYEGTSRIKTLREQVGQKGYAPGFQGLVGYVSDLLPQREVIDRALRSAELMYPEFALRELIANALIHQDLTIPGSGPMVEIFDDRLEITNPGIPLIQPDRFIDSPPQSRNERLARSMRQMGFCEERGSGWDKVTFEIEYHQLPPPLVEVTEVHTRVVLFAPRPLASMERDDRIRAIYQHACLRYVNREPMTNTTVRQRFGIPQRNSALASRLIREAVEAGVITPYDPSVGFRSMRYVPVWADPARSSFS
jgi:predicted HTH transcriptional regulator